MLRRRMIAGHRAAVVASQRAYRTQGEIPMLYSMLSASRASRLAVARLRAALAVASIAPAAVLGAARPAPPQTFDTSYAAPSGKTWPVNAGGNLQAALDNAKLGDTIVLQAGATFTGPFKLPNKTAGSGWIYVVSNKLA